MTSVPLDLNMYLAALIFHGLWWWSTTYSKNLYRRMLAGDPANPRAGRSARRFRALSFAQVGAVYYFAVILWLINAAARQYLSLTPFEFSGHSTLQTLFLFVLPHAVSLLIYQRLSLRWAGQMSAADQPAGQSQASLLMWLPGVIGIGCFALGLMPPLLGRDFSRGAMTSWTLKWCLAGFVGAILFGKLLQRFGPTAAGRVLEMDETPLKDEILRIAALTGVKLRSIRIQTFRARSSAPRDINYIATQRAVWWNHFQVRRPILPIDLLQEISSDALTAALASRFAYQELIEGKGGNTALIPRRFLSFHPGARILMIAASVLAIMVLGFYGLTSGWIPVYFLLWLILAVASLLILAVTFMIWRSLAVRRQILRSDFALRAFEVWRGAAPSDERTEEDYIVALVCFNRAVNPRLSAEGVMRLSLGIEATAALMNALGEERTARLRGRITRTLGIGTPGDGRQT